MVFHASTSMNVLLLTHVILILPAVPIPSAALHASAKVDTKKTPRSQQQNVLTSTNVRRKRTTVLLEPTVPTMSDHSHVNVPPDMLEQVRVS